VNKKLNKTNKQIEKVFNTMVTRKISLKSNDGSMSDSTAEQYKELTKQYAAKIYERFGIADCTKWQEKHFMSFVDDSIEQWNNGKLSEAYTIKQLRSAISSFQHGTEVTEVFKKRIDCINKNQVKETLQYHHIRRISAASTTLSTTEEQGNLVLDKIKESRSKHKEDAYHTFKISMKTGARFMDVLKLQKKNIDFENNTITFVNSKGGLTKSVPIDNETTEYLKTRCEGKKENSQIMRIYREKNGKYSPMTNESAQTTLGRIITAAGKEVINETETVSYKYRDKEGKTRIGTTIIEKKITHQTGRKIFTNERYVHYKSLSPSELNVELNKRLEDEKVSQKYQTAINRINKNKEEGNSRDMYDYEKSIFLTSLDSRHFRNDVLTSFYLLRSVVSSDRNEARKSD
jgi:integrase